MTKRIGFIGLGAMGLPMAKNILKHGYPLSVYDINEERAKLLPTDVDLTIEHSLQDLAKKCGTIITVLPDTEVVCEVMIGNGRLLDAMERGSTWIDMTTSDPSKTIELAEQAKQKGINVVDAPIGRSPQHAENGELFLMAGADRQIFAEVKPLLLTMATDVVHCGDVGTGHTMKLINNLLSGVIQQGNVEAITLGVKAGISVSTMLKVFSEVAVWNGYLEGMPSEDESAPGWKVTVAEKQLEYVKKLAQKHNVPLYSGSLVRERMSSLIAAGHGDSKYSSLTALLKNTSGIDVKK